MRFSSSRMFPGHQYDAQDVERGLGDSLDVLAELDVVAAEEEARQLGEILEPIAQRRHPDRDHVEPVVQVLAEPAVLDRLVEIDVGRGNEAQVRLDRVHAADSLDLLFLDRPQQLCLQLVLQVADLVEEQRAACGQLELAELLPDGAGEGTLLVTEERALDQVLGNRREVHRHEWRVWSARLPMDEAREQFLSGAALAEHKDGGRDLRHLLHQLHDRASAAARADNELAVVLLSDFLFEARDVPVEILAFGRVGKQRADALGVEVLGDVVICPVPHRLDRGVELPGLGDRRSLRRRDSSL